MLNTDKDLKLYYSIGEVARMFNVNESTLRFWEKEFPQLKPKKAGRGIRQYRKEDIEILKLIYHLVKERGMTLPGARQRMKDNKEATIRNFEIVDRLKAIREELVGMKLALDAFTYEDVEALRENLTNPS
ncbi:MerR family transcriptional regulator [Bacteroides sp.]|uniref:MerR family transcriptional regulator n=1 Tax=Bacteroides sp. TaxID=29523 RepID=UPI003AB8297F